MGKIDPLFVTCEFKKDTPAWVFDVIRCAMDQDHPVPAEIAGTPLEEKDADCWPWRGILGASHAVYFPPGIARLVAPEDLLHDFGSPSLVAWGHVKNYSDQYERLLTFLAPHMDQLHGDVVAIMFDDGDGASVTLVTYDAEGRVSFHGWSGP